jgi:hypothetical protein
MSSPFPANEPWRRQHPDYAESASTKLIVAVQEDPVLAAPGIIQNPACCRLCRIRHNRHQFGIRVLEAGPATRDGVDARMLALSTYMGHARLDSTYWYLHATPHLLTGICDTTERLITKEAHHDSTGPTNHDVLA